MNVVPLGNAVPLVRKADNGGSYRRVRAELIDCPCFLVDSFNKAAPEDAVVSPPHGQIGEIGGATVTARGVIQTRDGTIIRESLINLREQDVESLLAHPRPEPQRIYDGTCVLLKQTWDGNYGHWLIESLPRIAMIKGMMDISECRFVVQHDRGGISQVYLDSLATMGVRPDQALFTNFDKYKFERLVYPAPLTVQPWIKAPAAITALEKLVASGTDGPKLVYVSRNKTSKRRLLNEDDFLPILRHMGFVIVYPETMTFAEQISAFSRVRLVVGNLGAGLSNIVFAPRGLTLIALTTQFMRDDFYYDIICHKLGRYISLHGVATDPDKGMQSDFRCDPLKVIDLIKRNLCP